MSCRERFQRAYGDGLERQYAAYQKLNRGVSSPINFSHISLVSGLPFSPYPLTDFSTDITHPIREDSCGRLNPKWLNLTKYPCVTRSLSQSHFCRNPALLPKESRFPAFLYSFRRSRGRAPLLQAPENHFNEFTSGCTWVFNHLKINGLQKLLHIWPVSKESECAACFVTVWFSGMFFSPAHHEVNSSRTRCNILPITCPK